MEHKETITKMESPSYLFVMFIYLTFLLFSFRLLLCHSLPVMQPLCHDNERTALLEFKESFIFDCDAASAPNAYPKMATWNHGAASVDCCWWEGVECDEATGHVIGLDLSSGCLYGSINANSSLFRLVHLRKLNLAHSNFNHSNIPSEIRYLSRLTQLTLQNCGLYGEFPKEIFGLPNLVLLDVGINPFLTGHLPEFQESSSLQVLRVGSTSFSKKLPTSIGNLKSLLVLDLNTCNFSGSIPYSLSNLAQLEELDLEFNNFDLWTTPWLGKLSNLTILHLDRTNLYGHIPSSLQNLTKLTDINLANNQLTGPLPSWVGNLTQLHSLILSSNKLHGSIPQSVSRLVNLEMIELDNNSFTGTLEFDLFTNLTCLWEFIVDYNNLSLVVNPSINHTIQQFKLLGLGSTNLNEFPFFLRNQENLSYLTLARNNIQGKIPQWMMNVSTESLTCLELDNNFLTGFEQTPVILPWKRLEVVMLEFNQLQGPLPIPPDSVIIYDFSNNRLTGKIPPIFCYLNSLAVLDVSYNDLTGKPLQCLGNFSESSTMLDLQNNHFHGTIPQRFMKGCQLRLMNLRGNQLQEQLPRSLANCVKLEFLDVSCNQITDVFPSWLGTLPELQVLILRSNKFHGKVGEQDSNNGFSKLRIIDLSFNSFIGKLPARLFEGWVGMMLVDGEHLNYMKFNWNLDKWLVDIVFTMAISNKGLITEYHGIPDFLTVIDLSSNKFEGEIPQVIGSLKALHMLNLSNNVLTGYIPPTLGNIIALEVLDLSRNKLSGEIPQQLTNLTFLSTFSVAYNYLTGLIPQGQQFSTFENNSYKGNSGLCGKPLTKDCGDLKHSLPPTSAIEGDEGSGSPFQFGWRIVAIGYACGMVIGGVIGYIVVSRKQEWFMRTFRIRQRQKRIRIQIRGFNNHIRP